MKNILYVYGTLRTVGSPATVKVPGFLYALGWFPGAKIMAPECGSFILCERLEIDDAKLSQFDDYEGYHANEPAGHSLFLRRPYLDGWIYEYNHSTQGRKHITSGDWFQHLHELDDLELKPVIHQLVDEEEGVA